MNLFPPNQPANLSKVFIRSRVHSCDHQRKQTEYIQHSTMITIDSGKERRRTQNYSQLSAYRTVHLQNNSVLHWKEEMVHYSQGGAFLN